MTENELGASVVLVGAIEAEVEVVAESAEGKESAGEFFVSGSAFSSTGGNAAEG